VPQSLFEAPGISIAANALEQATTSALVEHTDHSDISVWTALESLFDGLAIINGKGASQHAWCAALRVEWGSHGATSLPRGSISFWRLCAQTRRLLSLRIATLANTAEQRAIRDVRLHLTGAPLSCRKCGQRRRFGNLLTEEVRVRGQRVRTRAIRRDS
jgi:hypothetical protein